MKFLNFFLFTLFLVLLEAVSKTRKNIFSKKTKYFRQFRFSQKSSKSLIKQAYEDDNEEEISKSSDESKIIKEGWLKISSIHLIVN